jgi:hypothetical protein
MLVASTRARALMKHCLRAEVGRVSVWIYRRRSLWDRFLMCHRRPCYRLWAQLGPIEVLVR